MAAREALERGVDQAGRKARSVVRQLRTGRTVDVGPELAEQDRPALARTTARMPPNVIIKRRRIGRRLSGSIEPIRRDLPGLRCEPHERATDSDGAHAALMNGPDARSSRRTRFSRIASRRIPIIALALAALT
jgi:hypothetical protein